MARKLVVEIVGDTRSLERSYARATKSTNTFGRSIDQAGRGAIAGTLSFKGLGRSVAFASSTFLGASGFVAVTEQAIGAASDLNEQLSKTRVVFGRSSRGVVAWSKTTSSAFGISRRAALGTASSFGALFRPLGITGKVAAQQSQSLTELGADLASFYNTDVASALDAIRSGLVGESEPLRQYGVLLSETRVQQVALADSGKKSAKSLTNQEKALARIKIIFEDTGVAQGDFARTSEGLANQSRTLSANLDDLEAKIGGKLTPTLTIATGALNDFLEAFSKSGTAENDFVRAMGAIGGAADFAIGKLHLAQGFLDAIPDPLRDLPSVVGKLRRAFAKDDLGARAGPLGGAVQEAQIKSARGIALIAAAYDPPEPGAAAATAKQRNDWFDAMIGRREDRVQDISSLRGQLTDLRSIAALISERIKATKDITRRLNLEDDLLDVHRQEQSILDQMRENTRDLAEQRKELAKQAAARKAIARNARQFRALGLTDTGEERTPGVRALTRQLNAVQTAVRGTLLDAKNRSVFSHIRQVLSGNLGAVGRDVRAKIKQLLDQIDDDLKKRGGDTTAFRHIATDRIVAGLGLTPEQARRVKARLSQVGPGGTIPSTSPQFALAGGSSLTVNGGLHLHGIQDMRALESEFAKRAKQRPTVRRGVRT